MDQKLWVALACPTRGLEFDEKTLDLIDTDKDARIRVPEVLAAVKWACAMLKDPGTLLSGSDSLPLASINDASPEGKALLASAKEILSGLGKAGAAAVTLADTADTVRVFAQTRFNGDGIIPADASDDAETRRLITEIIDCVGAKADRSGKPGVDKAALDAFFADAKAFLAWWKSGEDNAKEVFPLGAATADAASALAAIRSKVDDYFARCRLAAFDARSLSAMNRAEAEYVAIASHELKSSMPEVAEFPLALVSGCVPLPLEKGVNPAWTDAVERFRRLVVSPLVGDKRELTEAEWAGIKGRFAKYDAWQAAKAGASVERLGAARVSEILAQDRQAAVAALIDKDKALEPEFNSIAAVDKLVRFNRDLGRLLHNFVSFRDFYQRKEKAVFQAGTLYLDQRSCDLCVRVADPAKHGALAGLSRAYLAYCDLTRPGTGEKMTVAAAFSAGDSDNLIVGRNGIFYDRKGRDWDATIVKIVENPISISQAFWAPYKRVMRWIEDQIAKRAAAADAASTDKLTTTASAAGTTAATGKAPETKPRFDVGVIAALGVAVGGVTAALGYLLQAFFGLGKYMPLGVVALICLISGPSMIIAWLKLRQRNLGPLLDANGWAVNARARVNIPLGQSLTAVAKLPAGSRLSMADPFAESKRGRKVAAAAAVVLVALAALWFFGAVEKVTPDVLPKSSWVRNREIPAASAPVAPVPVAPAPAAGPAAAEAQPAPAAVQAP